MPENKPRQKKESVETFGGSRSVDDAGVVRFTDALARTIANVVNHEAGILGSIGE